MPLSMICVLVAPSVAHAGNTAVQPSHQSSDNQNRAGDKGVSVQQKLIEQSAAISSVQSEQSLMRKELWEEQERLHDMQRKFDAAASDSQVSMIRSDVGVMFNVLGLVLGVFGGIFLAGSQLSMRQERIANLHATKDLLDLGLREVNKEGIFNFFSLLGGVAVAIGFVLQFIGVIVTAPLSWWILLLLSISALVFSTYLILFFLRYTPDQTPAEKLAVVSYNLQRHIVQPTRGLIFGSCKVSCHVCLQRLAPEVAQVWWLYEENTIEHPYFHCPYNFCLGHEGCLPNAFALKAYFDIPGKYDRLFLGKASARDFLDKEIPKNREWYIKYHKNWLAVHGRVLGETPYEEMLNHIEKDLSLLMS
ncbi:MAG: hypothetical protein JO142_00520 [Burkholderiales bacterium]|nr:hypothetical protein [Burkholderiales bacterium]